MTKSTFIDTLRGLLESLNEDECNKFISYYEEIIEDYKESGLTEEEVIKKIGSPQSIAKNILSEEDSININIPSFNSKILNIILLILGFPLWGSLLLTVVLLILSAYIIIWCIPFTTGVSSIALLTAALFSIVGSPFMMADVLTVGIVQLGLGIASVGISILLGFITIYLSKKFIVITKQLTFKVFKSFNKKVVKI
ncbi:MAG: DUF1700 domain-containing protein [Clostridium septicum]|uniref:DUF1700 domain-containing protein n=1 Tax=Clostridium septicum TaxID=1504 RepID=UPI0008372EB1|nr:DUF1700 domain-containing protein [Clostridium septicum]MDU1314797.1 DUF1700 domain-containing protein [Clostridium septicum]WLF68931.1 DUF1700 domain-containing protein [Clostridium septicum]